VNKSFLKSHWVIALCLCTLRLFLSGCKLIQAIDLKTQHIGAQAPLSLAEDKLAGVSITRIADTSKRVTGRALGSSNFLPPEQLSCNSLDGRSDLFSSESILSQLRQGKFLSMVTLRLI
jgi:hypothetical protein